MSTYQAGFVSEQINLEKSGANIRAFRRERKITVKDFAQGLTVSPDAVYRWERGETMPKIDHIGNLCALLKKNFEEIFVYE